MIVCNLFIYLFVCFSYDSRRGGRDCRCPNQPRLPSALWTICHRLQPRLASPIPNQTHRIWATGRKAAVVAASGAVAVQEWVVHFYHRRVIPEPLSSAVSAVTELQSAAWAAVPGTQLLFTHTTFTPLVPHCFVGYRVHTIDAFCYQIGTCKSTQI